MKVCSKCGVEKLEINYFVKNKNLGKLHAQCKECYKIHRQGYYADHYKRNRESYLLRAKVRRTKIRKEFRENMLDYLADKKCEDCYENDVRVLEFDHINPKTKSFGIARGVSLGYSWQEIISEIQKCRILCANCHKKRTSVQFNWYKSN